MYFLHMCAGETLPARIIQAIAVIKFNTHPLYSSDLMLKPRVGDIESMSSPLNFFKIVVFPALSRPLCGFRMSSQWR